MAGLDAFKENQEVKVIDETKKVRIGIIGTGWIADSHISAYKNMPDVEVVAMADLIPGKAEAFAKKHGIENVRFYHSDKELLDAEKDLDGVSICTYNCQHAAPKVKATFFSSVLTQYIGSLRAVLANTPTDTAAPTAIARTAPHTVSNCFFVKIKNLISSSPVH